MNSGWCVMKSVAGRSHFGWAPVRINFQEWRYNMGCMTCKNKNITQTMVDCSKYVCDVHFLLIWLLLIKDYTTNNLIKVWHWIDQIILSTPSRNSSLDFLVRRGKKAKYGNTCNVVLWLSFTYYKYILSTPSDYLHSVYMYNGYWTGLTG